MRLLAKIGMKREVLDDAELLLEAVLQLAPDYQRRPLRLCAGAARAAQIRRRRARSSTSCWRSSPPTRSTARCSRPRCVGLGEHEEAIGLYRELLADAPRAGGSAPVDRPCAEDAGTAPEAIESYRTAAAMRPELRRCLLEPRQSQDLSLHG